MFKLRQFSQIHKNGHFQSINLVVSVHQDIKILLSAFHNCGSRGPNHFQGKFT